MWLCLSNNLLCNLVQLFEENWQYQEQLYPSTISATLYSLSARFSHASAPYYWQIMEAGKPQKTVRLTYANASFLTDIYFGLIIIVKNMQWFQTLQNCLILNKTRMFTYVASIIFYLMYTILVDEAIYYVVVAVCWWRKVLRGSSNMLMKQFTTW